MECTLTLKKACESKISSSELDSLVSKASLVFSEYGQIDFDIALIISVIHTLYMKVSPKARGFLLKIACEIQARSTENIFTIHHIDKLVALSIDHSIPDPTSRLDDERVGAFRCVALLIKFGYGLSPPIVRAMVSLFNQPKNVYKSLIASYLAEDIVNEHSIGNIEGVGKLFVDYVAESGSENIASFLSYSLEHKIPFVRQPGLLRGLLVQLSDYFSPQTSTQPVVSGLSVFLQTWPGLLYFGVYQKGLQDIMLCVRKQPDSIKTAIYPVISSKKPYSVSDAIAGVVLGSLLKEFTTEDFFTEIEQGNFNSQDELKRVMNILSPPQPTPEKAVLKLQSICPPGGRLVHPQATTPAPASASLPRIPLPADPGEWDWKSIDRALTTLIPHIPHGQQTHAIPNFVSAVVDGICKNILISTTFRVALMANTIESLVYLLSLSEPALSAVENNKQLADIAPAAFHHLIDGKPQAPALAVIHLVGAVLSLSKRDDLLSVWQLNDCFTRFGKEVYNPTLAKTLLSTLGQSRLTEGFMFACLTSPHLDVHKVALSTGVSGASLEVLAKYACTLPEGSERLPDTLNSIQRHLRASPTCRDIARKDDRLCSLLKKSARLSFCLLFADNEWQMEREAEISYWLETGNRVYAKALDSSVALGTEEPPHLFDVLGEGLCVEAVEESLKGKLLGKSVREKRGAVYAVGKLGKAKGELKELVETMVASVNACPSLKLRGSLLVALGDLVRHGRSVPSGFEIIRFDGRLAVLPSLMDFSIQHSENEDSVPSIPADDFEGFMNPLKSHETRQKVFSKEKNCETCLAAHIALGNYDFPYEVRRDIYQHFSGQPMFTI